MPQLLLGARVTVSLTVFSVGSGLVISLFLALGKMSKNVVLSKACSAYIFFFRGTPLLMQLFFVYYALPMIAPFLTINNRFFCGLYSVYAQLRRILRGNNQGRHSKHRQGAV